MNIRQQKDSANLRRHNAGYTIIELLEFIVAAFLARWLAGKLSASFQGEWHTAVYWTITIVGTLIIGFSFMIGLGYLFDYLDHRKTPKSSGEKDKSNTV